MDHGYRMHLVNTAAVPQYEGLKYADDNTDAYWLSNLLRLGILPEGYIFPREDRAVRDLSRKRCQLVQMCTANILSVQNIAARNLGYTLSTNRIKALLPEDVERIFPQPEVALTVDTNRVVVRSLSEQIARLKNKEVDTHLFAMNPRRHCHRPAPCPRDRLIEHSAGGQHLAGRPRRDTRTT